MNYYKINMVGNDTSMEELTEDQLMDKRNREIECTVKLSAPKLRRLESFYSPDEDFVMDFAMHKDCDEIVQNFLYWFLKSNPR